MPLELREDGARSRKWPRRHNNVRIKGAVAYRNGLSGRRELVLHTGAVWFICTVATVNINHRLITYYMHTITACEEVSLTSLISRPVNRLFVVFWCIIQ